MRTFLIEIQNRPDGLSNQSINSYSTEAITRSMFYQRCAAAITSTQFASVVLEVIDASGAVLEHKFIVTQYQPPEPEPDSEPDPEPESNE